VVGFGSDASIQNPMPTAVSDSWLLRGIDQAYIRRAWQTAAIKIPYIVVIRTIVRWTIQRFY
jgi:hypothetical protein